MKRSITSLKKANSAVLRELALQYPKGVEDEDLISFPTTDGQNLRAIELEVGDTIYLIKLDSEDFYRNYIAKNEEDEDEEDGEDMEDVDTADEIEELDSED